MTTTTEAVTLTSEQEAWLTAEMDRLDFLKAHPVLIPGLPRHIHVYAPFYEADKATAWVRECMAALGDVTVDATGHYIEFASAEHRITLHASKSALALPVRTEMVEVVDYSGLLGGAK
jgi:hypothetical protein